MAGGRRLAFFLCADVYRMRGRVWKVKKRGKGEGILARGDKGFDEGRRVCETLRVLFRRGRAAVFKERVWR